MKISLKPFVLSLIVVLTLFPFVYLVLLSLASDWRFPDLWPGYMGFKNWALVASSDASLLQSFGLSVVISLSVATISTLSGFLISRTVAFHPRKRTLTLLTYFPYVLSPVVFAACLSFFFLKINDIDFL